jgi:ADP-heptose:LPS heptosyltransferase
MQDSREHILIIKLGALGDFVQALGPFQAIRDYHPKAHLTLMTTKPFVELAEKSGWFDDVWVDARPRLINLGAILALRQKLRGGHFKMIYDLQTSDRSSFYYQLMWPDRPNWSGIAKGCSHPHDNPQRNFMHTHDRQADQLTRCGIMDIPSPDIAWMVGDVSRFNLPEKFILLVPGGAPHRPDKRWSGGRYAALAKLLLGQGLCPVVIGTKDEAAEADEICTKNPDAISLIGQTSLFEIAVLANMASGAVGNDTGPMHLIAGTGCPSLVLYAQASDPALCAQRGRDVEILQVSQLEKLDETKVAAALRLR